MFERFTDRARRVIVLAQEEARTLQHNYIGTEHLLLGLIRILCTHAAFYPPFFVSCLPADYSNGSSGDCSHIS